MASRDGGLTGEGAAASTLLDGGELVLLQGLEETGEHVVFLR